MKAMVLCAGLGTRLRPLTERWPKPAMPFLGQPLLRYHLAVLKAAGVTEVGINTHHLPDTMAAVARAECERAGLPLHVVHEPVIQGTGGGIRGLRDFLSGEDFLVFNGDILFPVDLKPVVAAHRESGAVATMVLLPMPEGEKYAAVEADAGGQVRRIAGYGPGDEGLKPWHFTGVHVMSPSVFDFMTAEGPEDINREVYVRVMQAGLQVRGQAVDAYWSDLGMPSRYLATVRDVLEGRVPLQALGKDSPLHGLKAGADGAWVHPEARVAGTVRGPAYVGAGAVVDAGATVGPDVSVGPGARVGQGAKLERCAVFEETQVAPGEALTEVLAWGPHRVPAPLTGR
ncbi:MULTISPECIES: nucleotidyltransferase family protein [unclassified Corallococcus]|uniref:nucleotidyltransferase family protein n=1 Tax=unclassified Corallococcus TaxID=2685029 RepID=UPI001A8E7C91|nr:MULTISPECIES: NDP-sugar synthase [unclassified Corallococcus]MBN9683373.1 NDP-sugar synthase [Corallococcus sp. NCSPR001]WAS85109.1 NDP-sugar synthase [Corallococcus sp. NCRR]